MSEYNHFDGQQNNMEPGMNGQNDSAANRGEPTGNSSNPYPGGEPYTAGGRGYGPSGQPQGNLYGAYGDGYGYQAPGDGYGYQKPASPQKKGAEEYRWNFEEYDAPDKEKKLKKKNRGVRVFAALICSIFAVGVVGFAGYGVYTMVMGPQTEEPLVSDADTGKEEDIDENKAQLILHEKPTVNGAASTAEKGSTGAMNAVDIAEKVRPSIVGIVTYAPTANYGYSNSALPFQASGLGSGIIMTSDGYIVTNAHVVDGAYGVKVILDNEDEYEAEVIGSDTKTDLAVIKINADNLTYAEFGDSSELKQGETVYVFGNPYGLSLANSMTQGIVSAINRQLKGDSYTINSIQTDAAINPGNSGGALVNEYGQVVGINSAKIAETDYEGIGFAIPISEAKPIIDELISHGYVTGRVKLGVEVVVIDETLARYNNIPAGIMIMGINEESSFTGMNVAIGDVLVEVNGKAVADTEELAGILKEYKPGDQVKLKMYRRQQNGIEKYFEVTVPLIEDRGE